METPYAYLESEANQMDAKARAARQEILRLTAIVETVEAQARSLRWAIDKQRQQDLERGA